MTISKDVSILIVDRSQDWGPELRARLAPLGLQVHVVQSHDAALKLASAKRIDVAVLEYAFDAWTRDLCAALTSRAVPFIYTARQAAHGSAETTLSLVHAAPEGEREGESAVL